MCQFSCMSWPSSFSYISFLGKYCDRVILDLKMSDARLWFYARRTCLRSCRVTPKLGGVELDTADLQLCLHSPYGLCIFVVVSLRVELPFFQIRIPPFITIMHTFKTQGLRRHVQENVNMCDHRSYRSWYWHFTMKQKHGTCDTHPRRTSEFKTSMNASNILDVSKRHDNEND